MGGLTARPQFCHGEIACYAEPYCQSVKGPGHGAGGERLSGAGAQPLRRVRRRLLGPDLGVAGVLHLHPHPAGLEAPAETLPPSGLRHDRCGLEGRALLSRTHAPPGRSVYGAGGVSGASSLGFLFYLGFPDRRQRNRVRPGDFAGAGKMRRGLRRLRLCSGLLRAAQLCPAGDP